MAISCRKAGPITARTHAIARKLCGQELRHHEQSAGTNFARALDETPSEAVVISSEALGGLLRIRDYASAFFTRIRELNLEPKLVLFVRNQSQRINSSYSFVVKTFRRSEPFQAFVQGATQGAVFRHSPLIELVDAYNAELIARPFTGKPSLTVSCRSFSKPLASPRRSSEIPMYAVTKRPDHLP